MTEVTATVESEHTPEPKWPERILLAYIDNAWEIRTDTDSTLALIEKWAIRARYPYRILKVQPPVERRVEHRVEIDWAKVNADRDALIARGEHAGSLPVWLKESIQRHARIVEEPKP